MHPVKDRSQTPIGHVDRLRELGLGKSPPPQTRMSPTAVRALLVISVLVNVALVVTLLVVR